MEEEDEIRSNPSPTAPGSPTTPDNVPVAVTVAAAPPPIPQPQSDQQQNSCLALVALPQQKNGSSGGGREDCWSEGATAVLIEAWGERYMELSRGNLKQKHWKEVADIVSSREDYTKIPKTDIQCKNRIDTVKKKYKVEKAKILSGGGPSKWVFFEKLDQLIGPTAKIPMTAASTASGGTSGGLRVPMGIPVGVRSQRVVARNQHQTDAFGGAAASSGGSGQKMQLRKRNIFSNRKTFSAFDTESEESDSDDSRDFLEDLLPPPKRPKPPAESSKRRKEKSSGEIGGGDSVKMLTEAILKFGEAYEQAESAKLKQAVEMEKQRMKFAKEMELQRMQFFMKTQLEISQLKYNSGSNRRKAGSGNGSNHHQQQHHQLLHRTSHDNNNGNSNSNNSDSDV